MFFQPFTNPYNLYWHTSTFSHFRYTFSSIKKGANILLSAPSTQIKKFSLDITFNLKVAQTLSSFSLAVVVVRWREEIVFHHLQWRKRRCLFSSSSTDLLRTIPQFLGFFLGKHLKDFINCRKKKFDVGESNWHAILTYLIPILWQILASNHEIDASLRHLHYTQHFY